MQRFIKKCMYGLGGLFALLALLAVSAGRAFAQTPGADDIVPTTWTFTDLTAAISAIAGLDIVKLTFLGLVALAILVFVARKVKSLVMAGR